MVSTMFSFQRLLGIPYKNRFNVKFTIPLVNITGKTRQRRPVAAPASAKWEGKMVTGSGHALPFFGIAFLNT